MLKEARESVNKKVKSMLNIAEAEEAEWIIEGHRKIGKLDLREISCD